MPDLVRSSLGSDVWGHLKIEQELTRQLVDKGSGRGIL